MGGTHPDHRGRGGSQAGTGTPLPDTTTRAAVAGHLAPGEFDMLMLKAHVTDTKNA